VKLTRLRIEQLRKFRRPLEIDGLEAGINLFSGPNEAGKSTIVAAIRAAFFERYRSNSAENLRPFGDSAASPTIELQFTIGTQSCHLRKNFLARKRCELQLGPRRFEGAEAETQLAELLGFTYAAKGGSQTAHWGIPGLLWIQQGKAHELKDAVDSATDHLRSALADAFGEIVAGDGDEILAAVLAARGELISGVQKKPRGPYETALQQQHELEDALASLNEVIADYRDKVDRLAQLREEQRLEQRENLTAQFLARQRAAQNALENIAGDEAALRLQRQRLAQLEQQIALLHSRLDGFTEEEKQLQNRAVLMGETGQVLRTALARAAQWQEMLHGAEAVHQQTRQRWQRSLRYERRRALSQQLRQTEKEIQSLRSALTRAEAEQQQLGQWQRQSTATPNVAEEEVTRLRHLEEQMRELRIRREAMATRLRFSLDAGRHIRIDDEEVSGDGERQLPETAEIELPGLGRLEISRVDSGMATLKRQESALAQKRKTLLLRLDVASAEAAERRHRDHLQLAAEISAAGVRMKMLAPDGIDAMRQTLELQQDRREELLAALAQQPEPPADHDGADTEGEIEAEHEHAERELARISEALSAAKIAAAGAQAAHESARREHDAARGRLTAPERAQALAAANRQLTETRAEAATIREGTDTLAHRIAAAQPDLLRQDVERWRQSVEQHQRRADARRDAIMQLDISLQTLGAQGLEEKRVALAQQRDCACRRVAELRRRAEALDLLAGLLQQKRRALTLALQAPLQKHLQHYVQMLFPAATIEIDENLIPGPLMRTSRHDQTDAFDRLSFGAREQLGVISRLAYADLLKAAGHPTLVILDDALVHSDDARLPQIKRILFDAATRHQILLFTCHPHNWRDLGAPIRSLPSLYGGAQ